LTAAKSRPQGVSSDTDGYAMGGYDDGPVVFDTIEKYPFSAPFTTASDVGNLLEDTQQGGNNGVSSDTDGFSVGGNVSGGYAIEIGKFPFSSPFTTASDIGDLGSGRYGGAGISSDTDGYFAGGYGGEYSNRIDKFSYATPFTTSTDIGNLTAGNWQPAGINSSDDGFAAGGYNGSYLTAISEFPFSSPFTTSTDVGDLAGSSSAGGGHQV
jgi:hypothetical protein